MKGANLWLVVGRPPTEVRALLIAPVHGEKASTEGEAIRIATRDLPEFKGWKLAAAVVSYNGTGSVRDELRMAFLKIGMPPEHLNSLMNQFEDDVVALKKVFKAKLAIQ